MTKPSVLLILLLSSCTPSPSEKVSDSLEMFQMDATWEFVGGLAHDRIILEIKRTEEHKLSYRIELVKNYLGLPLEYGTITLEKVDNDTLIFSGGSDACQLSIKMYESDEEPVGKRAIIERLCGDSTQNIQQKDFPPLHVRRKQ